MPKFRLPMLFAAALSVAPLPAVAEVDFGAYLAARQARFSADFTEAAKYYTEALANDPSNPVLLENALVAYLSLGKVDQAIPVARKMEADGFPSQIAAIALVAGDLQREDYAAVLSRVKADQAIGPLVDGLLEAWAHLGEGQMSAALERFDALMDEPGMGGFARYHKAMALASVGDYESAVALYEEESSGALQRTRRGSIGYIESLSQLDRPDEALEALQRVFGDDLDPQLAAMRDSLDAGETLPFTLVTSPKDGMAEVFFSVSSALVAEAGEDYAILYASVAEYLRPDHIDAILLTADLLEQLERYELAIAAYKRIPRDSLSYHAAELGRAQALVRMDRTETAVEVLEQLSQTHGDLPIVQLTRGDLYRQLDQFEEAIEAYTAALALYQTEGESEWFPHYARGIAYERLDRWDEAEADFRRALELSPDQPQVLNYLGYSMVEQRVDLDEALDMIERAVAARPQSGYIMDSLGWVLFRLGRYEEAVAHMERAAELEPIDPVVNDHLGDVYWAVGRRVEAEFMWHRALSFVDEADYPEDEISADRLRRKLEVGLDAVLEEEGSEPLQTATE